MNPKTISVIYIFSKTVIIDLHFNVSPAYGICSLNRSQLGPGVSDVQLLKKGKENIFLKPHIFKIFNKVNKN